MPVSGAPVTHEDDAERAVRAGLRITEAIEDRNAEHPGLDLAVRIGINTGEGLVVLGARPELGEGIVTGDVVNTASRLQGLAPVVRPPALGRVLPLFAVPAQHGQPPRVIQISGHQHDTTAGATQIL